MIVVWLLQSDTNLQLFYESKKSFLKYFHFQPLNLRFSTPKLTFRAWGASQKRRNKGSLRSFTTSCRKGKTRATTSTKKTTLSISHAQNRARSGYAMARKGTMKWNLHASRVTILLHGKQQNTTLRLGHSCRLSLRSVVHSCFPCSNLWSTRASKRRCPREELFKVVKVVQVVFLYVQVSVPVKALL